VDETGTPRPWQLDPPTVGAVVVSHNGARWLPKVLASFTRMTHAPTAWRVVDVASTDGSADLLRESFGSDRITYAASGTGFGDAVRLALESMPRTDWIWLLHDDAAVEPETLSALLDAATAAPDIAAVGPKIREWPSLRRLLEVGLTVTATGVRETGLETGEPDAGQHDRPRDVLAVNTAGMLVRRDVWDELDGFDRNLPLYFDDIDFGWRAARAGHRIRTAPEAVIFHAESSRRGTRPLTAGDQPFWEQRRAAIYTLLANTGRAGFAWQYVRLFFGSLLRVVAMLIGRDPESASDELLALRSAYAHPGTLRRARQARARTARRSPREVRPLLAPFWLPYQHGVDTVRETVTALVRPETVATVGRRSSALDPAPEETEDLDEGPSLLRRRPWLVVVLTLVVLSFVAARGLGVAVHGGALPPSPDTAGGWWQLLLGGGGDAGLPATTYPPLFGLPLALAATPLWFRPDLVVAVLLLLSVPLAALTAHRLGRRLTLHRPTRIIWAVTYALLVVATGAVAQGRLGTVVALVVAPIIVNTAWQLVDRPGRQVGLRLGIWIAVAAAFAPVSLALGLAGLVVVAVIAGRPALRGLVVAAVVPLVLLGPWLAQRALRPWRMWWEAGYPVPGSATVADVVLGRAGGPGAAPAWLTVVLLVLAVLALVPERTRPGVTRAWVVALIGLAVALAGTLVTYSTPAGGDGVVPWVGVPVVIWTGSLATAVLLAVPALAGRPRPVVALALVAALVLPLGTGAWWLGRGVEDPLTTEPVALVPAFLAERPGTTLVVTGTIDAGVEYEVVSGTGPFLGEEALAPSAARRDRVTAAVRRLLAQGTASDVRTLAAEGVDAIYAPRADDEVARRIDAVPLLSPSGSDAPESRAWTLALEPGSPSASAPWWQRPVVVLQALAWLVAIVLTAPVRRRKAPPPLDRSDEEVRA
jgi:GT2 family glycosyltransferase